MPSTTTTVRASADALLVAARGVAAAVQAFNTAATALEEAASDACHNDAGGLSSVAVTCAITDVAQSLSGVGVYLNEGGEFTADGFIEWVADSVEVVERLTADAPLAVIDA